MHDVDGAKDQPTIRQTAQMRIEYPSHNLTELVEEADRIVDGTVISTTRVVIHPRNEGDAPRVTLLTDLSEREQKAARNNGALAATRAELRVMTVHKGSAGGRISVTQIGGLLDGVLYTTMQAPLLISGNRYLLFLATGEHPHPLGGGAGSYELAGSSYLAMAKHAPVESLTREELAILITKNGR